MRRNLITFLALALLVPLAGAGAAPDPGTAPTTSTSGPSTQPAPALVEAARLTFGLLGRWLSPGERPKLAHKVFFTTDDGKTWFADEADKIPPFEKDGKPAYRVYVYRCGDGKPFVSHLERYTPEAKKLLEEGRANNRLGDPDLLEKIFMNGIEVKDPGTGDEETNWVKQSDYARASKITEPRCPDGKQEELEAVVPE
jgi:hypothetical protein